MNYQIAQGVQVSIDNNNWYALTDHNRQPINITYNLIEQSDRMANGTMRKYVIARKFVHKIEWKDVPTLDSYLVDYNGGASTVTTTNNATTQTNTQANTNSIYVPSVANIHASFTAYLGDGGSHTVIPLVSEVTPLPRIGELVTISGLTGSSGGYLQNAQYFVTSVADAQITISTPNVPFGPVEPVSGTISWIAGIPVAVALPGTHFPEQSAGTDSQTWFGTGLTGDQLAAVLNVGDTITIFGSSNGSFDGVFTVRAIYTNCFLVDLVTPSIVGMSYNTHYIQGSYPNNVATPVTVIAPVTTSFQGPYGPAWLKAFYEGNYSNPVYVRFIFAQQEPSVNNLPIQNTYTSSLQNSLGTNPATGNPWNVYQAFMTTFTYDVTKRMKGNAWTGGVGYDHVDVTIEFTEV